MIVTRNRPMARVLVGLALAATASAPLAAQANPEARLKKVEAEVRALQRKVFPDGASRYFEPEIVAPVTSALPGPPGPAATPVTDLIIRLDAVESALARATAQAEENSNRMGKIEARLATLETAGAPAVAGGLNGAADPGSPRSVTGTIGANTAAMVAGGLASPPAQRLAAVAAVVKPASDDPGEDDYLYGYRLWEAGFFPEAQQQLKLAVDNYPRHKRASYSRNLLGRAYLDDGKPGTAAQVFLQNYQADKAGDRAPDSLLFLAVAMTRLKETNRACVALAEFADAYPREAAGRLASQYAAAKNAVQCN